MKKQNKQELTRLYFRTDKERIKNILNRINIKYLINLYRKACVQQSRSIANDRSLSDEFIQQSYVETYQEVKYDGCVFNVSLKTIKDELKRREFIGEVWHDYVYIPTMHRFRWRYSVVHGPLFMKKQLVRKIRKNTKKKN